jgi:hypothetical protein
MIKMNFTNNGYNYKGVAPLIDNLSTTVPSRPKYVSKPIIITQPKNLSLYLPVSNCGSCSGAK